MKVMHFEHYIIPCDIIRDVETLYNALQRNNTSTLGSIFIDVRLFRRNGSFKMSDENTRPEILTLTVEYTEHVLLSFLTF